MASLGPREQLVVNRVIEARENLGLGQVDLAEKIGMSKQRYWHYEQRKVAFSVEDIFRLSRVLGRSVQWLLDLESPPADEDRMLAAFRRIVPPNLRELAISQVRTIADMSDPIHYEPPAGREEPANDPPENEFVGAEQKREVLE